MDDSRYQSSALFALQQLGTRVTVTSELHASLQSLLDSDDLQVGLAALKTIYVCQVPWDNTVLQNVASCLQGDALLERTTTAALASRSTPTKHIHQVIGPLTELLDEQQDDEANQANRLFGVSFQLKELRLLIAQALGHLANKAPAIVIPKLQEANADRGNQNKQQTALLAFQYLDSDVAVRGDAVARNSKGLSIARAESSSSSSSRLAYVRESR